MGGSGWAVQWFAGPMAWWLSGSWCNGIQCQLSGGKMVKGNGVVSITTATRAELVKRKGGTRQICRE